MESTAEPEALRGYPLLSRGLVEAVTEPELHDLAGRPDGFSYYYGTAPTGPVHVGYLVPLGKVVDLHRAGAHGKILIADYHAHLDDRKTPWEEMASRGDYYEVCLHAILSARGVTPGFVRGSSFETSSEYTADLYRIATLTTATRAQRAGSEVLRAKIPKVSELLYPLMQTLDVKHLGSDAAIGGIDQRHIYMLSRELLESVGWKKPTCLFTPLIPSLLGPGTKMSASQPGSFLSVAAPAEELKRLVASAWCPAKQSADNPVVALAQHVVIPFRESIEIAAKRGETKRRTYHDGTVLAREYDAGEIHPADLKAAVAAAIVELTDPVRDALAARPDLREISDRMHRPAG